MNREKTETQRVVIGQSHCTSHTRPEIGFGLTPKRGGRLVGYTEPLLKTFFLDGQRLILHRAG